MLLCTVLFSLLVFASPQDADEGVGASVPQSGNVGGREEGAASQVAMARDDKAAAMAEARDKFILMEQERIAREEAERRVYEQETRQHTVCAFPDSF